MENKQPIFQAIFGKTWRQLPAVMKKHYANRPFSHDITFVAGEMEIRYSPFLFPLIPLFRLFGVLVPYQGKNIPVEVKYLSTPNSAAFYIRRKFYFPGKKPYCFNSKMLQLKNNEVAELMRFGIGWKMDYLHHNSKVVLKHKGYIWKIGKLAIPLPLGLIMGYNYCEETPLSPEEFKVDLKTIHPLFGLMIEYKGKFKILHYEQK